jgi:hypothetical protein
MKKEKPTISVPRQFVPGRQYRGLRGKVVDWVEHRFEEGLLYILATGNPATSKSWPRTTKSSSANC